MVMPGLPLGLLVLWVGVGDGFEVGGVLVGEVFGAGEIVRVGTTARVGDALGPAVGWREAGDGTALAGALSVARTLPGQLSPAPTATAAPSKAVAVKAPSERRTISRTRDPGTCYLPETRPEENFFDT
jgi:hypothetical protein